MYVYCCVCYHMIAAPYIRSIIAHRYTLDEDSEHSMNYELSLLPNVFPYIYQCC